MAVKKTVKKRRTVKKAKVNSIDTIIDALGANAELSAVNKRAVARLKQSLTAVTKQEKLVTTSGERIDKARAAVSGAKTPAAKDKAKVRLGLAQTKYKELKAALAAANREQKKAERLIRGLYKSMETARTKMIREYDRSAKALEKSIDKTVRRRRTSKKKVVAKLSDDS